MTLPQQTTQQQSQHFLLKWNNHRSNMVNVFESLLNSENLVDCTICVEGKFLKAHKIVLSACSPYFQAMFVNHSPADRYPILLFHDIKFVHLKTLLEFMYRGEISIDERDLAEVLKVAEALSIRGLSSFESDDEEGDTKQDPPGGSNGDASSSSGVDGKQESCNGYDGSSAGANMDDASSEPTSGPSASSTGQQHKTHKQKGTKKHKMSNSTSSSYCQSENSAFNTNTSAVNSRETLESANKSPTPRRGVSSSPSPKRKEKVQATSEPVTQEEGPPPVKKKRGKAKQIGIVPAGAKDKAASAGKPVPKIRAPVPRQGVRRRIPRRYPGIPHRKIKPKPEPGMEGTDDTDNGAGGSSQYEEMDEALIQQLLEGEGCEPLSEMSVRGLDLFKYASVEDNVYRCIECEKLRIPKTFKNKYSFQRHAFLYHEGNMRKVFPCPLCSREFSRPDKMKNHMKSVHEGAGKDGGNGNDNTSANNDSSMDGNDGNLGIDVDGSCDS